MGIVTSHAVAAISHYGLDASQRLEKAMQDAILRCNQDGISNSEENSDTIRRCMREAHQRELLVITKEENQKQMADAELIYQARMAELTRAHREHLENAAKAFQDEIRSIEATLAGGQ